MTGAQKCQPGTKTPPMSPHSRAQYIWAMLKSYMLDECSLECAAVSNSDEANLINLIQNSLTEPDDTLQARVAQLTKALEDIRDHWANQYDHPRKENEMYRGSYGIGVTDGHRACTIIAERGLAMPLEGRGGAT